MGKDCATHSPAYIRVNMDSVTHLDTRPTGISEIGGSDMDCIGPIWVCNDCGAFLVQDFADDELRPITRTEYNEWITEMNERFAAKHGGDRR